MESTASNLFLAGFTAVYVIICLAISIFYIACQWILVAKSGQPGWSVIVPIYNYYIQLKIGGKPGWWLLLMLIPVVDIVIAIIALNAFLKAYGRGGAGPLLLMLFFPIFYLPYLAFSKNVQYVGVPS